MAAFRDRNGIMYYAPGGPVRSPYDTTSDGGYGGGYGAPPTQAGGPIVPGTPTPPPLPTGTIIPGPHGGTGATAPGLTSTQFGTNPYNTGIPLSNNFVAHTPTSNLDFKPGQYTGALKQAQGTLGSLQNMLMAEANGSGPNPAAEQLKQSTNRNISQAYALGQSSPNNAGAARNIAEQAGQINQQGAADAAVQRQQQQLAAQQQLGQIGLGTYGTSGSLLTDAQRLALTQAQGNQQAALNAQGINAQTSAANQQYGANVIGSGINAAGAAASAGATALGGAFKGGAPSGSTSGGGTGDVTPAPDLSGDQGDFTGGGGDTGYAAYGGMAPNFNGPVRHYDEGGYVAEMPNQYNAGAIAAGNDYLGKSQVANPSLRGFTTPTPNLNTYKPFTVKGPQQTGVSKATGVVIANTPVVGPAITGVENIGNAIGGLFSAGGAVPGQAQKAGNSYDNDTIRAMLSPGEIVLPRSVTQSPDAAEKAKQFVEAIKKKKKSA